MHLQTVCIERCRRVSHSTYAVFILSRPHMVHGILTLCRLLFLDSLQGNSTKHNKVTSKCHQLPAYSGITQGRELWNHRRGAKSGCSAAKQKGTRLTLYSPLLGE